MHIGAGPGHITHTPVLGLTTHTCLQARHPHTYLQVHHSPNHLKEGALTQLSWVGTHRHSHPSKGRARVQTMALSHPPSGPFSHANPPSHFVAIGRGALARTLPDQVTRGPNS